jgi:riboflavin transporter FmnP
MNKENNENKSEKVSAVSFKRDFVGLFTSRNIAVMAMLSALSFVLYAFVKFPLPFLFPGFLDMQFSDLPALLGGFALGPYAGGIIIVIKCLIKMPFSSTACVGELADIIIGLANVIPASIYYAKNKSKKGAIISLVIGMICAVIFALLANAFILIPFYTKAYGMEAIIGMVKALYPGVNAQNFMSFYLPLAVLPFNALRCVLCAVLSYFTYKPLSKALHWESNRNKD